LVDSQITVDGKQAPGEWSRAAEVTGFMAEDEKFSPLQSRVYVQADSSAIYVCFVSNYASLKKSNTSYTRDQRVYQDDAFEIFLQTSKAAETYYQFIGNSAGARYDAFGANLSWNGEWETRSSAENGVWTAEVRIPYSSLGVKSPVDGEIWGFSFCRDYKDPTVWTSFGGYGKPKGFGVLRFSKSGSVVAMDSYGKPQYGQIRLTGKVHSTVPRNVSINWRIKNLVTNNDLGEGKTACRVDSTGSAGFDFDVVAPVPPVRGQAHELVVWATDVSGFEIYRHSVSFVPTEQLQVKIKSDKIRATLAVSLDINGLPPSLRDGVTANVALKQGDKILLKPINVAFSDAAGKIDLDVSKLKDGDYSIETVLLDKTGKTILTNTLPYRRILKPLWKNNTLGLDDDVPPPWTPVGVSGNVLSVWNRTYDFGTSPFPHQITVESVPILAGPIGVEGRVNGAAIVWKTGKQIFKNKSKSKVTLQSINHAGLISMTAESSCEFDGLIRVDLTIIPLAKGTKLDNLSLRIPIKVKYAKYKYGYGHIGDGGEGAHFPWEKDIIGNLTTPWNSDFMPALWIGDESHGLLWFSEGQENWSQNKPLNALRLDSVGDAVVLTVNIVDTPIAPGKPIKLTFGLQATPAKPFPHPKDWLTFRQCGSPKANLLFYGWDGNSTRWQGFPVAGKAVASDSDPAAFNDTPLKTSIATIRNSHSSYPVDSDNVKFPVYLSPAEMVLEIPEASENRSEWERTPEFLQTIDSGQVEAMPCPKSKDWQDFFIYYLNDFFKKYDVDGIYMDYGYSQPCNNKLHGCGYDLGSKRKSIWPIFALHDLHRRIYKVVQKLKPNSALITLGHANGAQNLPHVNFWNFVVEGEYINTTILNNVYKGDYLAYFSPGRATVEFSGRPFGVSPLWLTYTDSDKPEQAQEVMALALLNGSPVWNYRINIDTLYSVEAVLDRFGVSDIEEFMPYWSNSSVVTISNAPGVYVTIYKKPGRSLVAVSNLSSDDATPMVKLDLSRLGLNEGMVQAKNSMTGETITLADSSFTISVKQKNFAMVTIEQ